MAKDGVVLYNKYIEEFNERMKSPEQNWCVEAPMSFEKWIEWSNKDYVSNAIKEKEMNKVTVKESNLDSLLPDDAFVDTELERDEKSTKQLAAEVLYDRYLERCELYDIKPMMLDLFQRELLAEHDPVINPPHYKGNTDLQSIDVIESFELGYRLGNVVKYVLRAGKKGDRLEDLQKALWYLEREINQE